MTVSNNYPTGKYFIRFFLASVLSKKLKYRPGLRGEGWEFET
jgi:hypothetical protein